MDLDSHTPDLTEPVGPTPAPPPAAPARLYRAAAVNARDVLMLVNGRAGVCGGGPVAQEAQACLEERGFAVTNVCDPTELTRLSRRLRVERRLRAVVAVGGDGTLGLALNQTPPDTPLVVLPAGTENLLAKYLGFRARPEEIAEVVADGVQIRLDAGEANGRLFALMVSVGIDAEVVRRVHSQRRGNITHLAYAWPILDSLRTYRYPALRAHWHGPDGAQGVASGRWLFGVNLPRYAQGLRIAPRATGTDALLDLCMFRRGDTAASLWYLWHLLRGRHHRLASVSMIHCRRFRVESATGGRVPFQLDGDPGGYLPVDVRVAPGRMTCLVRPEVARGLGFQPSVVA